MSLSAAEKKRKQRERAKRGSHVLLGLEIVDWDAWVEILREDEMLHGADSLAAVRLATERYIWDECRAHRREKAQEQLSQIRPPITGLIDRETEPRLAQLIKAKDVKRPHPDDTDPKVSHSIIAEQRAEQDGFGHAVDWYDEHEGKDDGLDPSEAEATVAEGGFQVEES